MQYADRAKENIMIEIISNFLVFTIRNLSLNSNAEGH